MTDERWPKPGENMNACNAEDHRMHDYALLERDITLTPDRENGCGE